MNAYKEKLNNAHIKQQMALVAELLKQGKKDEARLVLEYVKTWNEIAYFSKKRAV